MSGFTPSQEEDIANFSACVGNSDRNVAIRYLLLTQGDLIAAVNAYLAETAEEPSLPAYSTTSTAATATSSSASYSTASYSNARTENQVRNERNSEIGRVSQPRMQQGMDDTFAEARVDRSTEYFRSFLGNLPGASYVKAGFQWMTKKAWAVTPGFVKAYWQQDLLSFTERFDRKYTNPHPLFHSGTYYQAAMEASHNHKLFLVYLHSNLHQDTDYFCKEILADERVISCMNSRFIVWAGDVAEAEAYKISLTLGPAAFPFCAILNVRNSNQLLLVDRLDGCSSATVLSNWMKHAIDRLDSVMAQQLVETMEVDSNRELREQQEQEFEEARQADLLREREEARLAMEQEKQNILQEQENKRIQEQKALELMEKQKLKEKKSLALSKLTAEPELGTKGSVALQFRLPDGKQINRRFMESDKLQHVFVFIDGQDLVLDNHTIEKWELVANYPKRTLSNPDITLAEADLKGRAVLFVQEI